MNLKRVRNIASVDLKTFKMYTVNGKTRLYTIKEIERENLDFADFYFYMTVGDTMRYVHKDYRQPKKEE